MLGVSIAPGRMPHTPDPVSAYLVPPAAGQVALGAGADGGLSVWTELGQGHAAWMTLDHTDPATRFSWRETLVTKLRNVYPVNRMTLSGSWSQLQSSGSGLAASYTGNRAISTSAATALATVDVDRDGVYDLWVHFTGRTQGGYVKVQIDGGDTLVNEIDDPAALGFKAFSTFSAQDLQRRQVVRVASGLSGAHQVTLSLGGPADPGGNAILIEAVSITGALNDDGVLPPVWQAGRAYTMGDEVQWNGLFYAARATGVSGSSGPTHGSGIASDGAMDWRADNRPTYPEFIAIDYASEREYALRLAVAGVPVEIGGQTHGNEVLSAQSVMLDGVAFSPRTDGSGLRCGAQISIAETTDWQDGAGAQLAQCTLDRTISAGQVSHDIAVDWTGADADVAWFYPAMLPFVHWDGEQQSVVGQSVQVGRHAPVDLAQFAGSIPANVTFDGVSNIALNMAIGAGQMRYGMAAAFDGLGAYDQTALSAFLRPNLDGRTAAGSMDWPAKAYVAAGQAGGMTLIAGMQLGFSSRHVMAMS